MMLNLSIPIDEWGLALGWALIHSLWQGALLVLVLFLVFRYRKSYQPSFQVHLGFLALSAMFAAFVLTFYYYSHAIRESFTFSLLTAEGIEQIRAMRLEGGQANWEQYLPYLTLLWILGSIIYTSRWLGGLWYLHRLRNKWRLDVPDIWIARLKELQMRMGIHRSVELFQSDREWVPMVIGHFKPAILLPIGLINGLTQQQVEAILVHELAHIRRNDFLWNQVQSFLEMIFFYHPAYWWISARIEEGREHSCDDMALQNGADAMTYAHTLLHLAEGSSASLPAPALSGKGQVLLNRIQRLIQPQTHVKIRRLSLLPLILLLSGILGLAWISPEPESPIENPVNSSSAVGTEWMPVISNMPLVSIPDREPAERMVAENLREASESVEIRSIESDKMSTMVQIESFLKEKLSMDLSVFTMEAKVDTPPPPPPPMVQFNFPPPPPAPVFSDDPADARENEIKKRKYEAMIRKYEAEVRQYEQAIRQYESEMRQYERQVRDYEDAIRYYKEGMHLEAERERASREDLRREKERRERAREEKLLREMERRAMEDHFEHQEHDAEAREHYEEAVEHAMEQARRAQERAVEKQMLEMEKQLFETEKQRREMMQKQEAIREQLALAEQIQMESQAEIQAVLADKLAILEGELAELDLPGHIEIHGELSKKDRKQLEKLMELELSELAELKELEQLGNLEELKELAELKNLAQLKALENLSDDLSALKELKKLEQLKMMEEYGPEFFEPFEGEGSYNLFEEHGNWEEGPGLFDQPEGIWIQGPSFSGNIRQELARDGLVDYDVRKVTIKVKKQGIKVNGEWIPDHLVPKYRALLEGQELIEIDINLN